MPRIEMVANGIAQCMDCGAYDSVKREILHYEDCHEGTAKYWADYYEKESVNKT